MKRAIQSRLVFWAGLAFVVATLSGCANFQKLALDKGVAQKIDKVAIVDAREPVKYVTMNFGHPGMMFGAIGGAIAGADMEAKGTQFTNALRSKGFTIAQHLTDKTAENLLKRGYKIERVPDTRVEKEGKLVLDYTGIKTDADVVMNITPTMVGYVSTRGINGYIPTVGIVVEMVSKNSSEVIYREHFMYGWEPSAGEWVHVPAETGYSYSSFQDLMEKSVNAAEGLTNGAELVSARIAQDFQKN